MAFMFSELRTLTYQSDSRTVVVSELNIRQEGKMAPQQRDGLPKSSDFEVEAMQNLSPNRHQSDLGTSVTSSLSPPENGSEGQIKTKIEEPSSDDSGSVQITQTNQESESPLMKLQSALKENGRLGEKLHAPSSLPNKTDNSWIVSASPSYIKDLPSTSSGNYHVNSPPEMYRRNLSPTTTGIYQSNLPISSTSVSYSLQPSSMNNNGALPINSVYGGFYPNVSTGTYYNQSPSKEIHNGNLSSNSAAYNAINSFSCRVCDFTCILKEEYDMHMNDHYNHKCPHCNYTSRTEGRLKRHVKEFHSDTPPESWAGTRSSKKDMMNAELSGDSNVTSTNGKARAFKCKQCEFVAYQKAEFWKHTKIHIKPEKLLQCPHCEFVTEFKHHYEYHIMNHFGRKPFECSYCNYKCVNKSMLNSHLKSHSSVYQFHCADCKYETKYCHSIKQHLKKQNHRPGIVFGQDGTPCPNIVIDVYGKRRGPRAKKRKLLDISENNCDTTSVPGSNQITPTVPSNQGVAFPTAVPLVQQNIPMLNSTFVNFQRDLLQRLTPQVENSSFSMPTSMSRRNSKCFNCKLCPLVTDDLDLFNRHTFLHMATENADLAKIYGINLELMRKQEIMALNGEANGLNNCSETEQYRQEVSSNVNDGYESHGCKQEYEESVGSIKREEEGRSPKYRRISIQGNDDENDSFRGYSSPSPPGSSNHSSDMAPYMEKASAERSSPDFVSEENRMEDNESPIDLSGRKSSDSTKTNRSYEDLVGTSQSNDQNRSTHMQNNETSPASQRNRRKGKAYKINHYLQYDDQSPQEEQKEVPSFNNTVSCEDDNVDETKDSRKELSQIPTAHSPNVSDQRKDASVPDSQVKSNDESILKPKNESQLDQRTDLKTSFTTFNGHTSVSNSEENGYNSKSTTSSANEPSIMLSQTDERQPELDDEKYSDWYECVHCEMLFKSVTMYTMHKGYHALKNPFCCNFCGHASKDKIEFYIHTATVPH